MLLPATARFLRSILVPIDPEVEVEVATVVPLPVEVSASSMGLVRALLDVFARAQDAEAAALVLSASLKQVVPCLAICTAQRRMLLINSLFSPAPNKIICFPFP